MLRWAWTFPLRWGFVTVPVSSRATPGQQLVHLWLHGSGFEPAPKPYTQKAFTGVERGPWEKPLPLALAGRTGAKGQPQSHGSHRGHCRALPKPHPGLGASPTVPSSHCPEGPPGDPTAHQHTSPCFCLHPTAVPKQRLHRLHQRLRQRQPGKHGAAWREKRGPSSSPPAAMERQR